MKTGSPLTLFFRVINSNYGCKKLLFFTAVFLPFVKSRNSLFAVCKYVFFTKCDKYFIKILNYMLRMLDGPIGYSVKYICVNWGEIPSSDNQL